MLALALLAIASQADPNPRVSVQIDVTPPSASGRNLWTDGPGCRSGTQQASEPISPGGGLAWRSDSPAVGHYLLLERRIEGCSVPLLVSERVPGSNAVGREVYRFRTPATPRPVP